MQERRRERQNISALSLCAAVFLSFVAHMQAGNEKLIFDFTKGTNNMPGWQVVNDSVMGGVSRSGFSLTNGMAVFAGEVSLENNGGFASVRSAPQRLDIAGTDALILRVRGDGRKFKFTARTDADFDSPIYQAGFETRKGEWQEHRFPISSFVPTFRGRVLANEPKLEPAKITSFGFLISDQQAGPFRLEIEWVKAAGIKE